MIVVLITNINEPIAVKIHRINPKMIGFNPKLRSCSLFKLKPIKNKVKESPIFESLDVCGTRKWSPS